MFGRSLITTVLLAGCALVGPAPAAQSSDLSIAAASDLSAAFKEITTGFEKQTGTKVKVSFGSSGNFYAQIQNGAPYDLFFSADVDYPTKLEAAGLAEPGSLYKYGEGRIVLWVPKSSAIDLPALGMNALLHPSVRKVAIANPSHAPYGRAAMSALEHFSLTEKIRDKLVFGENISQATQFMETGNAEIGFTALSLALSPALKDKGTYWLVPPDSYPKLEQAAIVLKSAKNKAAADAFLAYLKTPAGNEVMRRFGFGVVSRQPQPTPKGPRK